MRTFCVEVDVREKKGAIVFPKWVSWRGGKAKVEDAPGGGALIRVSFPLSEPRGQ